MDSKGSYRDATGSADRSYFGGGEEYRRIRLRGDELGLDQGGEGFRQPEEHSSHERMVLDWRIGRWDGWSLVVVAQPQILVCTGHIRHAVPFNVQLQLDLKLHPK